jgi:hypothetical protein
MSVSITNLAGTITYYTATPSIIGGGWDLSVGVELLPGAYNVVATATDSAGNVGVDTTTLDLIVVDEPPRCISIDHVSTPFPNTNAPSVTFRATFNLPMTNLTEDDFVVRSNIGDAEITTIAPGDTPLDFLVTIDTGTGVGFIGLNCVTGGGATDTLGNPLSQGFNSVDEYIIDSFRFVRDLPTSLRLAPGQTGDLEVEVAGNIGPVTFTWLRNNVAIPGSKALDVESNVTPGVSTLTFDPFEEGDGGSYKVVATDTGSSQSITSATTFVQKGAGVPISGMLGMTALSIATALGGAMALRRRRD